MLRAHARPQAKKFAFKCHRRQENGKDVVYPVNSIGAHPHSCVPMRTHVYPHATHTRTHMHPLTRTPAPGAVFHPVYGTFATGGCDGVVAVWDGEAKKRLYQFAKYPTSVASLAFNAAGTLMAVASSYTFEEGEKQARGMRGRGGGGTLFTMSGRHQLCPVFAQHFPAERQHARVLSLSRPGLLLTAGAAGRGVRAPDQRAGGEGEARGGGVGGGDDDGGGWCRRAVSDAGRCALPCRKEANSAIACL